MISIWPSLFHAISKHTENDPLARILKFWITRRKYLDCCLKLPKPTFAHLSDRQYRIIRILLFRIKHNISVSLIIAPNYFQQLSQFKLREHIFVKSARTLRIQFTNSSTSSQNPPPRAGPKTASYLLLCSYTYLLNKFCIFQRYAYHIYSISLLYVLQKRAVLTYN